MSEDAQYDQLVSNYAELYPSGGSSSATHPLPVIEAHQMWLALTDPDIDVRGKRILDLACGNGYSTGQFLSWGAASVTGVDISSAMIEEARREAESRDLPVERLRYVVGDASDESLEIEGAPFDIVTASWLLNYAKDVPSMSKMWNFISRHLKLGGVFVGLSVPPLLAREPWERDFLDYNLSAVGPWGRHGNPGKTISVLPDGNGYEVRIQLGLSLDQIPLSFDNYHPSLKVFEQSCAASAAFLGIEWRNFEIPELVKNGRRAGFWNDMSLCPHCRVFTARKKL